MINKNNDQLLKFIFSDKPLRGSLIRLNKTIKDALEKEDYYPVIKSMIGELMIGLIYMISNIKFEGEVSISLRSNSKVSFILVCGDNKYNLKSYVNYNKNYNINFYEIIEDAILTIDLAYYNGKKYQSIISLNGVNCISDAFNKFFNESSQIPTFTKIGVNEENISAIMVQHMPEENNNLEEFNNILYILNTITNEELVELDFNTLLYRLFNEYKVELLDTINIQFKCNCNKEKIIRNISLVPETEVDDILIKEGQINVTCEFCKTKYEIIKEDLK